MSKLSITRAGEIINQFRHRAKVVVYGDVMLDEFVWGTVTRISPEAPVPVVDVERESVRLGGAANVLANLVALGARACIVGVVGDDSAGVRLRDEISSVSSLPADEFIVVDSSRPSTVKTRIIAHSQHQNQLVVRADRERRTPVDAPTEDRLIDVLRRVLAEEASVLIVSDYDKGAVTPRVLREVLSVAAERGIPVLIDPKARNFAAYHPATLIKPNHHEALRLTDTDNMSDEGLKRAASMIHKRLRCDAVLITRGGHGMMLMEADHDPVYISTTAREVYDVTGAGDTVIATLGAALAAGASMTEAAVLANYAAGIVVAKVGTTTAGADELLAAIELPQQQQRHLTSGAG